MYPHDWRFIYRSDEHVDVQIALVGRVDSIIMTTPYIISYAFTLYRDARLIIYFNRLHWFEFFLLDDTAF